MIVIFRWWFFAGIGGLGLAAYGGSELALARRASPEPVPMELAALEAGEMPPQPHIRIGSHVAMFDRGFSFSHGERVESVYYPVALCSSAPHAESARHRTVVVKTKEFKRLDEVPDQERTVAELSGILTTAERLRSEDRAAVMRMVGGHTAEDVPVLEAHRHPQEELICWIILGSGGLLFLWAIHLFRARRRRTHGDATLGAI